MLIDKKTVLDIEKTTQCPIIEMFYTPEDDRWYVCFEEDIIIKGKNQIEHLNDVLEEIKKYNNIEYITNEIYEGDEENNYYQQITFQWKEPEKEIYNQCKDCIYRETLWNVFNFNDISNYCQIHKTEITNISKNDIRFCKEFKSDRVIK